MKKPAAGAGTIVYGYSDNLVECEGQYHNEFCDTSALELIFSDGTVLSFKYGHEGRGPWHITIVKTGVLLIRVERCKHEDAYCCSPDVYSDVAIFDEGLTLITHSNKNIEDD